MEYYRDRFHEDLEDTWPVEIAGNTWPSADVFRTMAEHDYSAAFTDWVENQKLLAKERARTFLEETGSLDRFRALCDRHNGGNVVPFVGAGMSVPSGFRPWGEFLLSLLADAPHLQNAVAVHLAAGQFELAAQTVYDELGPAVFDEEIQTKLGKHRKAIRGPVCLLPELFVGQVFTTNFDYTLEHVYSQKHPFASVFCGQDLAEARMRIGDQPHSLLKLHGEADSPVGRILTQAEYARAYAQPDEMVNILDGLISRRSLLFLGCSLSTDRTFEVLQSIRVASGDAAVRHYAFLPCPSAQERLARRTFLAQAEIHPIYYPPDDHDQPIEDLLLAMMEGGVDD